MGGPKLRKKSPRTQSGVLSPFFSPLERVTHTAERRATQYSTYRRDERPRLGPQMTNKRAGTLPAVIRPEPHSHGQEVQMWERAIASAHLQQRIGEAVFQGRMGKKKKREVTLTTLEPFNCEGLDISSKPLTSCLGTQCHGACALTQHLFYLLADWTHFTVKRGQLGCKGIKNTGKKKKKSFSISRLLWRRTGYRMKTQEGEKAQHFLIAELKRKTEVWGYFLPVVAWEGKQRSTLYYGWISLICDVHSAPRRGAGIDSFKWNHFLFTCFVCSRRTLLPVP